MLKPGKDRCEGAGKARWHLMLSLPACFVFFGGLSPISDIYLSSHVPLTRMLAQQKLQQELNQHRPQTSKLRASARFKWTTSIANNQGSELKLPSQGIALQGWQVVCVRTTSAKSPNRVRECGPFASMHTKPRPRRPDMLGIGISQPSNFSLGPPGAQKSPCFFVGLCWRKPPRAFGGWLRFQGVCSKMTHPSRHGNGYSSQ